MRRATTILIGILLGALATGLGVGLVLKKANDDRERLAEQVEATVREANAARDENRKAIEDANAKLQASNVEVSKAQQLIKALEEERLLLALATPLADPSPKAVRGWNEAVAVELGVSLKQPQDSSVQTNDKQALTLVKTETADADSRWFSLTPYEERLEQELLGSLATSTPVSYLVDGHILIGAKGTLPGRKEPIMVLRVRYGGQITHLIWVKDPSQPGEAASLMNVLASIRFAT